MRNLKALFVIMLAALFCACAKPVPPEKAACVGEWNAPAMTLLITQDGSVSYRRLEGGVSKSVEGSLEFEGDNFVVGVGPLSATFVVSVAPHKVGTEWKMTVDGVELTRKQ